MTLPSIIREVNVHEVQKAIKQCKEQIAEPGTAFNPNHCTEEQEWLMTKAEEALRTLRAELDRPVSNGFDDEQEDKAWLSIDIIAIEGGSKSISFRSYTSLSIL